MREMRVFKSVLQFCIVVVMTVWSFNLVGQVIEPTPTYETLDSLYILEVEQRPGKAKVLHAEPLYIDLIRDLGARKGEKEWNIGFGMKDNRNYDEYETLVEYEWAPIDRLGLEVELPFSFFYRHDEGASNVPQNRLNSLKVAAQWSFFVSEKMKTTLALGYLHEFELAPFNDYGRGRLYNGNLFNPFIVAAKRWGQNYHTLIYAGPEIFQHFGDPKLRTNLQWNTNLHYMIPGTRNFIGIEFNKDITATDFDMIIRPQMRVAIRENLMIGIVSGIPFRRENERFSSFVRIIYEPGHH
jgi:hypothetical protein